MKLTFRLLAALAALFISFAAAAQAWPTRPVKIVVPFPPGGTTDILARMFAERLQGVFGQPFLVENRGGAGGVIGTDAVAKSPPDGYTLLLSSSAPLAVGLKLYKKVPYDAMRDLAPVSMVADVAMVLAVSPGFKATTVNELIAYAKSNPGKLNIALNSLGSQSHLLTELFRVRTGTSFNMVPYKGTGPAVVDLMAGVVDADFENLPAVVEHIRGNRLRALAVLSASRSEVLPNVPTMAELGMSEFVASPWFAIAAPAGTPAPIVARLNEEINKILKAPATRELLAKQGANPVVMTPEETARFFREEIDKWARIVAETGAKLE
ncbi:MAG: tripartite tricarboxylate transporter substrate binding protein [Burkholderiales bacterium]|nr:tripartite tricarboxylate transporter substrate binding protein [Burkholderiales bacterium]ODU66679.1 MAG: protein BugT [Lautropia sp. SCN 66-9]